MLSAEKMSEALRHFGINVMHYEESKNPKHMDGEVILGNSLSVQVGFDYACLCLVKEDGIDYLLEIEGINNEIDFATEVAKFLKTW
jgi:signal recognition particle subunit SEC65